MTKATNHMTSAEIDLINDRDVWDQALLSLPAMLYHTWEWGEVRAKEGWQPSRVLARRAGKPVAAVQVLERQLLMPLFRILYAPRGIAYREDDPEAFLELTSWLKQLVKQRRAMLLRMDPFVMDSDTQTKNLHLQAGFCSLPHQWSRWNFGRTNMVIDISLPAEKIFSKMRSRYRSYINSAEKRKISFVASNEMRYQKDFYLLLQKSSARQQFAIRDFEYFSNLIEAFSRMGNASLFLAYSDGTPAAGIFCIRFSATSYYVHGGFDWNLRDLHAIEPLHWMAMNWAKDVGCTRYDLMGAGTSYPPHEGNYGYGLYSFKKGLGAELLYLAGYFDLVGNPVTYRFFRFLEDKAKGSLIGYAVKLRQWLKDLTVHGTNRNVDNGTSQPEDIRQQ